MNTTTYTENTSTVFRKRKLEDVEVFVFHVEEDNNKDRELHFGFIPAEKRLCVVEPGSRADYIDRYPLAGLQKMYKRLALFIHHKYRDHLGYNTYCAIQKKIKHKGQGKMVAWAVNSLKPHLLDIIKEVAPKTRALHRAAFSSFGQVPGACMSEEALKARWERLIQADLHGQGAPVPTTAEYITRDFIKMRWLRLLFQRDGLADASVILRSWQRSGRARKALAQLPGGLNAPVVADALPNIEALSGVPTRRRTWIAATLDTPELAEAMLRASDYEHRKAFRLYREARAPLRVYTRSIQDAYSAVGWIDDAREDMGLTRRAKLSNWVAASERWHREALQRAEAQKAQKMRVLYGDEPAPKMPGLADLQVAAASAGAQLTQLRTWKALQKETERMNHCVWSYAGRIYEKRCYILRWEEEEGAATLEVRPGGRVRQSCGPGNLKTEVSKRAERILNDTITKTNKHDDVLAGIM